MRSSSHTLLLFLLNVGIVLFVIISLSSNSSPISVQTLMNQPTVLQATVTVPHSNVITAEVSRVIDGDTIELKSGERVRYIGIDTPEMAHDSIPANCFAEEAKNMNEELVLGKTVRLARDVSDKDKYGRLLRYVYAGNVFINEYLVAEGYALAATYPPDVKFANHFVNLQVKARTDQKGLWEACSPQ